MNRARLRVNVTVTVSDGTERLTTHEAPGALGGYELLANYSEVFSSLEDTFDILKEYKVKGRNLITGLPTTIKITEKDTERALTESVNKIVNEIINILDKTPPELSADIVDKGLVLTGGGSLLNGLQNKLKEELNIPVLIAQSPLTCVIEGTKVLLNDVKKLNRIV